MITVSAGQTEGAKADGDTRTIYLHHAHTHESIEATYLVDGRYDSSVLEKLNWFLRDWRRDESIHMDPRLFDTIWEVYRESGSRQPIEVMSAYRSPETNAMLRRRSRAVAEHSQHILGKAMDQHYVDVPMSRIREIAMKLQRGGVGFYPTAGTPFVHMDVGGVRHWPRMSYDQLARLFPDGKTVHIPSNGQPLPGYELARAELEARGDSFSYPTATEVKSKGFFAWLFGGSDEDEDNSSESRTGSRRGGQTRVASLDRTSTGSVPPTSSEVFGMSGKDDGGAHSFTLADSASRSGSAAPPLRRGPVDQPAPVRVASRPAAPSADDQAKAQQALAEAMVEQNRAKQAADAAAAAAASAKLAEAPEAQPAASDDALAAPIPTTFAPMPPRRPTELASDGPAAPLPPGRPTEFAGLAPTNSDRAPGVTAPARRDSIGALIAGAPPSRVAGLPAAITAGARPEALPQVLAYAAPIQTAAAVPPPRPLVPMPVARPSFVAARLDRSNFRTLTGSSAAMRAQGRSGLGSAVAALRPAQSTLGVETAPVLAGTGQGFKTRATDLSSDHFAGQAVKPREHIVTAASAVKASAE